MYSNHLYLRTPRRESSSSPSTSCCLINKHHNSIVNFVPSAPKLSQPIWIPLRLTATVCRCMHLNHTMPRSSPTFVAPRPREESYVSVADQIAAILPGQLAVAEVENLPKIRIDNSDYVLEDWLHKRQKRSGAIFSFAALKVHNGPGVAMPPSVG